MVKKIKKRKGKSARLGGGGQLPLLAEASFGPELAGVSRELGSEDFINPRPEALFCGTQRLRDYLESRGMTEVLRLRELIFESDLSGFLSDYSPLGRRPLHPGVMLGLIYFGIMEGKRSLRDLEDLARFDVRAWWLCGGAQPDHSTIGNFLNRFRELLTEEYFLTQARALAGKLQLGVGGASADGTVLEAAASRFRAIKREAAEQALAEATRAREARPQDEGLRAAAGKAQVVAETLRARCAQAAARSRKASPRICPSEPEAVIQKQKGHNFRPSYKGSVLTNGQRLILGQDVHPSDEGSSLGPMLLQYEQVLGGLPTRLLLDAGYHNYATLSLSVERELNVLCPAGSGAGNQWEKNSNKAGFGKAHFRYEAGADVYRGPCGQVLRRCGTGKSRGLACLIYECRKWRECGFHGQCTKSKGARRIQRFAGDELKEAMAKVFEQPRARAEYRRRKAEVEPVFSEFRGGQNFNRFRRFGLAGAKLEFSLHCQAYNLKRALRLMVGAVFCFIFGRGPGGIRGMGLLMVVYVKRRGSDEN